MSHQFCYEAIFQHFSNIENQFITNITNDAWFGQTIGPKQHLATQIFRAIEKSMPLIRSTNSGISVITDENGKIIKKIDLNKDGFLEVNLSLREKSNIFESFGNYSTLILIVLVFFILLDRYFYQLKVKVKSRT